MSSECKIVEINGGYAICCGNTLVDMSRERNGGLYETEKAALEDLHYQMKLKRLRER